MEGRVREIIGDTFVLLRVDVAGTVTAESFIAPLTTLFADRFTTLGIPHPVLGFDTLLGDGVVPYPEWAAADLDGDHVPELISIEAITETTSFTHVQLRITPHFVTESATGAITLKAAPPLLIHNWALIDGRVDINNSITVFSNPGDLSGRLLWGELNGDGRADLLALRPTDHTTHDERPAAIPSTRVPQQPEGDVPQLRPLSPRVLAGGEQDEGRAASEYAGPESSLGRRGQDLPGKCNGPVLMSDGELWYQTIRVGRIANAFESDATWFGTFTPLPSEDRGTLRDEIDAYIAFCRAWDERLRDPANPPDAAEFDRYRALIHSGLWCVRWSDGASDAIAEAPVFFFDGDVTWRVEL